MADQEPEKDTLQLLLKQNWDQVKHLRSIIMWFTELYIGLIVGAVVLLERNSAYFKDQPSLLMFFLIISLLGLLITIRMDIRIECRSKIGREEIAPKLNLGNYSVKSIIKKYAISDKGLFTWRHCLILFYAVMCVIWTVWMYLLVDSILVLVVVVGIVIIYCHYFRVNRKLNIGEAKPPQKEESKSPENLKEEPER